MFYKYNVHLKSNTMKILRSMVLILLVLQASSHVFAQKKADPAGTWTFYAETAPYEYSSGDIVIAKESGGHTAKIVFGENYEVTGRDVVLENDQLAFNISIEGQTVYIKGTVTKATIEGTASYTEGTIPFKAERKKEK